jgi:hypothetical protein
MVIHCSFRATVVSLTVQCDSYIYGCTAMTTDLKAQLSTRCDGVADATVSGAYDGTKPLWAKPSDVTYTSCYCEENVWQLCDSLRRRSLSTINTHDAAHARHALDHSFAVFISNPTKSVINYFNP